MVYFPLQAQSALIAGVRGWPNTELTLDDHVYRA
jgi:hypothetical protein